MNDEMRLEMQRQSEAFERIAESQELQNALLLQLLHELESYRAERHPDPEKAPPMGAAVATRVVDSFGDLYGDHAGEWEFDPIANEVEKMGGRDE